MQEREGTRRFVMSAGRRRTGLRRIGAAAVVALAAGAALAVATRGFHEPLDVAATAPPTSMPTSVVTIDDDGYRYAYHVPTGTETLFELRDDPRMLHNVRDEHPQTARRLRAALELRLHVESLDLLRTRAADTIRRLQSLGYL